MVVVQCHSPSSTVQSVQYSSWTHGTTEPTSYSLTMFGWFSFFMTAISCTTSEARGVVRMLALRVRLKLSARPVVGMELALAKPFRCARCSKLGLGTGLSAKLFLGL